VCLDGAGAPRLTDVCVEILDGVTAVLGPSGSGKTSLLNLLIGFEAPDRGTCTASPTAGGQALAAYWVPQNFGLWPHLTAREHLRAVMPGAETDGAARIEHVLAAFDIGEKAASHTGEMSHGERARLAVARALASSAAVLIMDEPLASVDPARCGAYWRVIRSELRSTGASLVFSTHAPDVVLAEAEHVLCVTDGKLLYAGAVQDLYWRPPSEVLARCLGEANWLTCDEVALWLGMNAIPGSSCLGNGEAAARRPEPPEGRVDLTDAAPRQPARTRALQFGLSTKLGAPASSRALGLNISTDPEAGTTSPPPPGSVAPVRSAAFTRSGETLSVCLRPEQVEICRVEHSSLVVRSSQFRGAVADVELEHRETGQVRVFHHRPAGPGLAPGHCVTIRTLLSFLLLFCGAGLSTSCDRSDTPRLGVRESHAWPVPSDGTRIPAVRGIALSADGTEIFTIDTAARLLVLDRNGTLLRQWRMPESKAGTPEDLTVLRDGCVAVPDTHYHRVVVFDRNGVLRRQFGTYGTGPGQFVYPVSLAEDDKGNLYVCEYGGNDRIQKFAPDGKLLAAFGGFGTKPGEFQRPAGIVWHAGKVYVADSTNHRIQAFTDSGAFVGVLEVPGAPAGLQFPYDITIDAHQTLLVAEWGAGRVSRLGLDGRLLGRFGSPGTDMDQFLTPWGLACDGTSRILVADTGNRRIVELRL